MVTVAFNFSHRRLITDINHKGKYKMTLIYTENGLALGKEDVSTVGTCSSTFSRSSRSKNGIYKIITKPKHTNTVALHRTNAVAIYMRFMKFERNREKKMK